MKANILIVDDTLENLNLLIEILKQEEYNIRPAKSGKIGLYTIEKELPDIILLDVVMPELDGFEVCRILKANPVYQKIPVIFISALDQNFDKVRAFELGAVDYITKPFNENEVKKRIDTHLRMHNYQLEVEQKNQELEKAITLLNEKQGQLIQYEKMASLGVLAAGLAHEINNPINYIHNSILAIEKIVEELLNFLVQFSAFCTGEPVKSDGKIKELMGKLRLDYYRKACTELIASIKEGVNRSTNIIKSLRIFSHQNNEKKQTVKISECLDTILQLLAHSLDNITVKNDLGNLPVISGNPGRLNQLFMNLLTNAIDAFDEKKVQGREKIISINSGTEIREGREYISITIADNARGIPYEIQRKIYDPFFTTKDVGKGVGLGLYIAMAIINEHNGILDMESTVGKGTTFRILLPVEEEYIDVKTIGALC